jgi:hypothetical protein
MRQNSKGANKLLSIYWFFILVLVSGGIVLMVHSFYSSPYDVREGEAEILSKKIATCISNGGTFSDKVVSTTGVFLESFQDNFMKECNFNFDVQGEFERPQYYFEVDFYDFSNLRRSIFQIAEGNQNWKADCNFENPDQSKISKCVEKEFFTYGPNNKIYLIKILTVVGKTSENAK